VTPEAASGLTTRGRVALAVAGTVYLVGWAFGMQEATPVAIGLALAVLGGVVWVRLGVRPMELIRRLPPERLEGDSVTVRLELRAESGTLPSSAVVVDDAGELGRHVTEADDRHGALRAEYGLDHVPRGRYRLSGAMLLVEDPFGLVRRVMPLGREDALSVYPRLVELGGLFSEGGVPGGAGRRLLLSRVAGYDVHGVRDHQPGESLRAVHWKSSARRRRLMVKEFEDTPRDEAAVILDARRGFDRGTRPDSSFDLAVRAAGSLLRAVSVSGQPVGLHVSGRVPERRRVATYETDWPAALELLARVRADGARSLAATLVARDELEAVRIWVVTSDLADSVVDRLVGLAASRRDVAVAYVDAASFASEGEEAPAAVSRAARLRLAAAAIPVAELGRGCDLAARLGSAGRREARELVEAR
jgi:uncharacterized protein (DUF58 family)